MSLSMRSKCVQWQQINEFAIFIFKRYQRNSNQFGNISIQCDAEYFAEFLINNFYSNDKKIVTSSTHIVTFVENKSRIDN